MRIFLLASVTMALAAGQTPFAWPEGKRVAVSFSFDDARASQITTGLDLLARHGAKVTFYVNPRNMVKQTEGWRKAAAQGHEIGNHSETHPCSANFEWSRKNALEDYTLARMDADIENGARGIEKLAGVKPITFAYPCGSKYIGRGEGTQSYVPLVAKKYLVGRGFRDEAANDPVYVDLAQLNGVDSDGMTFEEMRERVTEAAKRGAWLVFAGHEIGQPGFQTTEAAQLDKFLSWARQPQNGVWLDTVETVAKYVEKRRSSGNR